MSWPGVARLVRGEFLALKNREFVQACHTLGMSDLRIMLREVLPNRMSPIIVIGSLIGCYRHPREWSCLSRLGQSQYHELGFPDWRRTNNAALSMVGMHVSWGRDTDHSSGD